MSSRDWANWLSDPRHPSLARTAPPDCRIPRHMSLGRDRSAYGSFPSTYFLFRSSWPTIFS